VNTTAELEAASYATWSADESDVVGGWHVTATAGVTRRINSARAIGAATVDDATLHLLTDWFRGHDLPLVIRETPLMAPGTSEAVRDRWGFEALDETHIMTNATGEGGPQEVQIVPVNDRGFQYELAGLNHRSEADAATTHRIYDRVGDRSVGLWIPGKGTAVAVRDGDLAAIFAVAVSPENRRTRIATRLMEAASAWAAKQGAQELFVQVLRTNRPAIELYEGLGFTERYRYRYLRPQPVRGTA